MHHAVRRTALALAGLLAAAALPGCAFSSTADEPRTITLVAHDSWAMDKNVLRDFEDQTGFRVRVTTNGDAGALTNKLVLTEDDPIGDVVFGIDNTFASRAVDAGVLRDHTPSTLPAGASDHALTDPKARAELTPVDYGDVCINVDDAWYAAHHRTPPRTLADLVRPAYARQLVVPGPTTSSPGLAFLLTTIAAYGEDGWRDYWRRLLANGTKVDAGWSDAYETDFTGGGGSGDRPIVLSYASSIPFTIPQGQDRPTTSALLGTCFRQVEYAGVLQGTRHPKVAAALVDFMLSKRFQAALPDQMYVYPVASGVALPPLWERWAKVAPKPWTVAPERIAAHRTAWLAQWRDLAAR